MGLISASSLGQPIIKINNTATDDGKIIASNARVGSSSEVGDELIMAPALTTETSAEHRKRSLSHELSSNCPKLESLSSTSSSPGGNNITANNKPEVTQPAAAHSDEELALKAAADEVLGHNVDEILQVLESMESGGKCGGGSTPGEDSMLRLLGSDLELLAGGDICGSQETEPEPASPTPKVAVEDKVGEASERQHLLERRCERLMRRVRKMQARGTARHAAHQLQDLVTSARALLKARNASHRSHSQQQQQNATDHILDTENVKNMSAAALVSLVQKISGSGISTNQGLAQALSPDQASALRDGAGSLRFRLHHSEAAFDSDVTASSSGGESCDEAMGYNPNHTATAPICKRAAWRYARERASVVSRWTWLQANISDLEYRIRQYSECHRQLRVNKGAIRLDEPSKPVQGEESMVVNGCHAEAAAAVPGPSSNPEEEVAARTRPLDVRSFCKRKIVVPGVMYPKSGKRSFPPHNQPPCCRDSFSMPCVLCFSKRAAVMSNVPQPAQPSRDFNGRENCRERAARLDPAIHPVLSGLTDVSRSLHMAAHLRQPAWQQTQLRQRGLARLGLGLKRNRAAVAAATSASLDAAPPQRRKYTLHKKNNNTANVISAKIRRKAKNRKRIRGRQSADGVTDSLDRYRRPRKYQRHSVGADGLGSTDGDLELQSFAPSPASEGRATRRKREDSYDIDNIVIPYSMAALTRVEKLEYKEILTPKWRVVEIESTAKPPSLSSKNGVVRSGSAPASPESDVEDISDEAVTARHEVLEMEERRKFRCPPSSARGVRSRRTDSRAESSGANTPDPMSPNPVGAEIGDSPMASPRATPLPPAMLLQEDSQGSKPKALGSKTPGVNVRRRTVSSQRASPEPFPQMPEVAPFELRTFPLAEELYQRMLTGSLHLSAAEDMTQQAPTRVPSPPPSPCGTDSTESAVPEEDEDMDPEWTLESAVESPQSNVGAPTLSASSRGMRRSQ